MSATNESGPKFNMKYVYILQSETDPKRFYTGCTNDLNKRLKEHNTGQSIHTNKFKPWRVKTYISFDNDQKADKFEDYLKSGNGRIFTKKHF